MTKDRILDIEGVAQGPFPHLRYDVDVALRTLARADAVLGKHIARIGPFQLQVKHADSTFSALAEAIVYQQLSGKAAATIFGRVRALFPDAVVSPNVLLTLADEPLRGAGLSAAKLRSLRDLADKTVGGSVPPIDRLHRMSDDAIIECLTDVRGIGRWTVEMLLLFRLGRPDVFPLADYGIRKGFALTFRNGRKAYAPKELPDLETMTRRAERWRPFRSVASWYLWRALD
jgi:3-methyladenine DNA glycosylase/8-oxoguanine DNA glycosylase